MSIYVIILIIFIICILTIEFNKENKPTLESVKKTAIIVSLFLLVILMFPNKKEYSLPKVNTGSIVFNEQGSVYENTNTSTNINNSFNNTINNSDSICHQGRVTTEDETRSIIPKFRKEIQEVIDSNTSKICTRFPMALAFFENGGSHLDRNGSGNVAQSRNAQGKYVGAIGLMQVMPFHAHTGGICAGMDLYNVEDNIRCGYKIAKSELIWADKEYNSEPDKAYDAILLAAAAYNAGRKRAKQALKQEWRETKFYAFGVTALNFLDVPIYVNSRLNQSKGGTEVLANVFTLALKAQLALKESGEFLGFEKINASKSLNDFTINIRNIESESVKKLIKEMRTHTTISFGKNKIKFSLNGNGEKYINNLKVNL